MCLFVGNEYPVEVLDKMGQILKSYLHSQQLNQLHLSFNLSKEPIPPFRSNNIVHYSVMLHMDGT